MPIYEYSCRKCGHRFEYLVTCGKESGVVCPECGAPEPQKMISSFGIGGGSSRIKASSAGVRELFVQFVHHLPLTRLPL